MVSVTIRMLCILGMFTGSIRPLHAEIVDLQLVLAIDVSSSVNYVEFGLQMQGYAAAFRDSAVHQAIASGPNGKIAVSITEWAGIAEQQIVIPWTVIASAADAEGLADRIEYLPRSFPYGGTAIHDALRHALALFDNSEHVADRRVIDISGDGKASLGPSPVGMRDRIIAAGVTINGLPILNEEPALDRYYEENVVGGPGAFVEISKDFTDFTRAIAKKLAQEIRGIWYGV
jgi:hypothetical protein